MGVVFDRTKGLTDAQTHYCAGCTHGIIHRLVAEVLEELNVLDTAIGIAPVGCSVLAYNYFSCDMFEAAHGRAPAVATGVKRSHPGSTVFTYQGDGDLAAIGTAEIVHAAARGELITTIFVNNCIYGMTGGQMAPTTLPGQITETTPGGRDVKTHGNPIQVSEMIATLKGAVYVHRVSVDTVPNILKAKKAIKRAFEIQRMGLGFTFVEVLSTCPTNWGLSPVEALKWLQENMMPFYTPGIKKDTVQEEVK